MTLTIGSLFSGIGGIELGLEEMGLGPVLWWAESDPFCRTILARHWVANRDKARPTLTLEGMARKGRWPTPTKEGNRNRKGLSAKSSDGLQTAVWKVEEARRRYPTPLKSDSSGGPRVPDGKRGLGLKDLNLGPLNPTWVEWLMGFPIGWTVLPPSATPSFRRKRRGRGKS